MKNSSEICVPVSALALPGEKEGQNTAPAVGDVVDITGTAKVSRIEGDKAYITPDNINGAAIEADAKPENLDDDEAALRDDAKKSEGKPGEIY